MATLRVNGVDMAYDVSGDGAPVVLLHAGIADRTMWDDVTPMLASRFRVIACDLRGFGETPLPDGPFVYAADVAAMLEGLGVDGAHLIGVSMGGQVALDLTLARPELVGRLVLVGAGIDGWRHEPSLVEAWAEEEAAFERGDLDEVAWINVRTWLDGPGRDAGSVPNALRRRVYEMQRAALDLENPAASGGWLTPSRRARLGDVAVPTLVLVGALDQRDFRRIAQFLAAEIPGAAYEELPGVAHLPPLERPAAFARTVLGFLDGGR